MLLLTFTILILILILKTNLLLLFKLPIIFLFHQEEFLKITASLESTSEHPISKAIVKKANEKKIKLLSVKKDLVKANIEERLDIGTQEREELRKLPEGEETVKKILDNEKEKTNLEKTLAAIDADDWATVDSLIV